MTDAAIPTDEKPAGSKKMLFISLGAFVFAGLAAFAVMYLGVFSSSDSDSHATDDGHGEKAQFTADIAFLPLETLVISLGPTMEAKHLLISIELEVSAAALEEVTFLQPRIADVLNSYLRALDPQGFVASTALVRLRSQMLRRVQLILGEGKVRDLLITEFVLN